MSIYRMIGTIKSELKRQLWSKRVQDSIVMPLSVPPMPKSVYGIKKKNGTADRRFRNSYLVQMEDIDIVIGSSLKTNIVKNGSNNTD